MRRALLIGLVLLLSSLGAAETIRAKADQIILPSVQFAETPLTDAIDFLRQKSIELDESEPANQRGINLVLDSKGIATGTTVTLKLSNISLSRCFWLVAYKSGTTLRFERDAAVFAAAGEPGDIVPGKFVDTESTIQRLTGMTRIPSLEFNATPLGDAIAFYRNKSVELDERESSSLKGFNLVIDPSVDVQAKLSLKLNNIPFDSALHYITKLSGTSYNIDGDVIMIVPQSDQANGRRVADRIIIPSVEFHETPVGDVLGFLALKAKEHDPAGEGLNILLKSVGRPQDKVNCKLNDQSLSRLLYFVGLQVGSRVRFDESAAVILSIDDANRENYYKGVSAPKVVTKRMEQRCRDRLIPSLEFSETPIADAVEFIASKATDLEVEAEMKKVNVFLNSGVDREGTVTMKLSNISLFDAMRYTCELTGNRVRIDGDVIVISPLSKGRH